MGYRERINKERVSEGIDRLQSPRAHGTTGPLRLELPGV